MTIGRPRTLTCPCGTAFDTTAPRTKYCNTCRNLNKYKHRNGAKINRTLSEGMFIGVDGEGYTAPDGIHRYTMLSVGNRTLLDENGEHLDILRIFDFLWQCYEDNPGASYIGFFLGYDFTQWVRTLPENKAWSLHHKDGKARRTHKNNGRYRPFPVDFAGWEFDILGDVRFRLRRQGSKSWMYICDTGPYFQKSFLSTINPANWSDPVCTQAEYDTIVQGKQGRGDVLTAAEWVALYPDTKRYNTAENAILATVMDRIKTGLVAEGIHLTREQWFGPGQAAQEWLSVIGQPTRETIEAATPAEVLVAAQATYYGGWFEIFAHGHLHGTTWEYDLNSAYPAAMTHLPCLLHGTWTRTRGAPRAHEFGFRHVTLKGSHPVAGAAQCRRPDGTIARPHHVRGWYWCHEIQAAKWAGLVDTSKVHDGWTYVPDQNCGPECNPLPDAVRDIYQRRLSVGKNTAHGIALKIVYNSAYGKLAQSIGTPKYGNAIAASFITSWCRSQILDAIATHPEGANALAMVATDGVYFRAPHPTLEVSPGTLGAWDEQTKENMTLLKPGVYWDDKARQALAEGRIPSLKSRGVSARDLAANIATADELFASDAFTTGETWPSIRITRQFNLIGARSAITRGKWHLAGQIEWQDGIPHTMMTRDEYAHPASKRFALDWERDRRGDFRAGVWAGATVDYVSVPYSEKFGRMGEEAYDDLYRDTPGGPEGYMGEFL